MSGPACPPPCSLQEERQEEQCRDLRALLKLLSHVTQRDFADLSNGIGIGGGGSTAGAAGPQLEVAQVVLLGLSIVLPLMSLELLKFPKLRHFYFMLLR